MTITASTPSASPSTATSALPAELLQAVSSLSGGKLSLVVGAGCSFEPPTGIPVARVCSVEVHRRLVADGILVAGECSDPEDLSAVADTVFAKIGSQGAVVKRLCDQYDLKLAKANEGYLVAAAMMCEGVITSVVTLNFDLAMSDALTELGAGPLVGVIEGPHHLSNQKTANIYYLHRNVNAADPEAWVLRSETLNADWKGHWEPIIATRVLSAPVVVFAGLGTPVAVLIESARLIRSALPSSTHLYQVDPANRADSRFFAELAIDPSAYIQRGWCQFMDELSQRLSIEQIVQLEGAVTTKTRDDGLPTEDLSTVLDDLRAVGLVNLGLMRAHWLLHDKSYCPSGANAVSLVADLLLGIGLISRVSGAPATLVENGLVVFLRDGRAVAAYLLASGGGHRGRPAIEAQVDSRRRHYRTSSPPPRGVIVSGTSDPWAMALTPPPDVVRGAATDGDIVAGPTPLPLIHVSELRADASRIAAMVP